MKKFFSSIRNHIKSMDADDKATFFVFGLFTLLACAYGLITLLR